MGMPGRGAASHMLREDHRRIEGLYQKWLESPAAVARPEWAAAICRELEVHAWLEERLVYPELARHCQDGEAVIGSFAGQHGEVERLVGAYRLAAGNSTHAAMGANASLERVMTAVARHMAEEEADALPVLAQLGELDQLLGAELVRHKRKLRMFPPIHKVVELEVPVRRAYGQWTQFEAFPRFLEHVQEVRQLDDATVFWRVWLGGREITWTAQIYEQVPDQRIAWRHVSGARNAGSVSFLPLGPNRTRVLLDLWYEPDGLVEGLGALLGVVDSQLDQDLAQFKRFLESGGQDGGGRRGQESGPEPPAGAPELSVWR